MNAFDDTYVDKSSFAFSDAKGQDKWSEWTPTRTGWTDVGTPTVTGRFHVVGKQCFVQAKIVPATSIATVAGTSYIGCPIVAAGLSGDVTMFNSTTNVAVGSGGIDVANSRMYLPTQGVSGNTFTISGWYEI